MITCSTTAAVADSELVFWLRQGAPRFRGAPIPVRPGTARSHVRQFDTGPSASISRAAAFTTIAEFFRPLASNRQVDSGRPEFILVDLAGAKMGPGKR